MLQTMSEICKRLADRNCNGDREKYNGNWALRAAAAKLGIYGNNAEEAVYPFTRCDIDGVPLDGSRTNYRLTF
ncbi:MAG: hypothetical protein R3A12_10725 [Ignavibacteria bacterium]